MKDIDRKIIRQSSIKTEDDVKKLFEYIRKRNLKLTEVLAKM